MSTERIGAEAVAAKGRLGAHKWLLLRRASQLGILALFLLGPLAGIWIVKGNLTFSYTLTFYSGLDGTGAAEPGGTAGASPPGMSPLPDS